VLVRLSDDNKVAPGQWYLEAGFDQLDGGATRSSPTWTWPRTGLVSASQVGSRRDRTKTLLPVI
jgi:hypothetical protein